MECENICCKYQTVDGVCSREDNDIFITRDGLCGAYEKGLAYYLTLLPKTMKSNFLCMPDLTDDLRYSIYYLMKCTSLAFAIDDIRGIMYFKDEDTGERLINAEYIWGMLEDADSDKVNACAEEFYENGLPEYDKEPKKDIEYKQYGWLSPTGIFYEAPWGDHEGKAMEIIKEKGWYDEFDEYESIDRLARDFLAEVKGYALIHDPTNQTYIVSHEKPLTKKQREFLYGYFMDMDMVGRAESFLED